MESRDLYTLYLTREEVAELTGYKQPKRQIGFLTRSKIRFIPNRLGIPMVHRDDLALATKGGRSQERRQCVDLKTLAEVSGGT